MSSPTKRFAGNPLAVVLESGGLDTAAMQTIAREFNLPETVFVFPPDDSKHRARLRIFTPARELPFAGHPTVGTAVLLAHLDGGAQQREIVLGEVIGPVACTVQPGRSGGSARFGIPKLPEKSGGVYDPAKLAAALGLDAADLGFGSSRRTIGPQATLSPSSRYADLDAMARARPDMSKWQEVFPDDGPTAPISFAAMSSILRSHITRECLRRRWASPKTRDRLRRCGLCRCAGRFGPVWRRRACGDARARLRDGAAEPDPAYVRTCAAASSPPRRSAATRSS